MCIVYASCIFDISQKKTLDNDSRIRMVKKEYTGSGISGKNQFTQTKTKDEKLMQRHLKCDLDMEISKRELLKMYRKFPILRILK